MARNMEQYMSKTRADYRSGVARPKIEDKDNFELKGQILKELPYSEASHINNSIPRKEKDLGSFTLPCFINNVCFNNALADLGASILIRDLLIGYQSALDLGRAIFFLPTMLRFDAFKRKVTLRVGEEKIIFKSVKPASSLIKRVYMLGLRERMELDLEARLMGETLVLNRSLDPFFGDYIELNDLNVPLDLRRNQILQFLEDMEGYRDEGHGQNSTCLGLRKKYRLNLKNDMPLRDKKHYKTLSLDESRSLDFNLFSDQEEYSREEVAETMAKTMEQYMSKTRADYGSGVARPKIEDKDNFELKGQILKELRTNTFSGSDHKDANEHIKKVLEIMDLFHIPNITIEQVMLRAFPMSLTGAASRWLRNKPSGSITTWEDLKTKFLSKYCPPARTAKKMEEINNFQQKADENLYQAWERFKELLMKCPQHYLTEIQEVVLFYNGLDVPTRQILDSKGAIPSKTIADAKVAIQEMAKYS
ncbi:pyruvate dehydrogenase (acetyl-transferring) kinase, mitochondrial [Tanacetum coccineum]